MGRSEGGAGFFVAVLQISAFVSNPMEMNVSK